MTTILIPVDGSRRDEGVIRGLIAQSRHEPVGPIHLLSVQPQLTSYAGRFLARDTVRDFQRERGQLALARARALLDAAGLPYTAHVRAGSAAETIAQTAAEVRAQQIHLGMNGGNWLSSLLDWLSISRLRRHATVPVVLTMTPDSDPLPIGGLTTSTS
ncbi:MAG: universal stress protein [Alphaproteobacteria bacterium]|nr:universal stress protein [Alphaproteobacteria bacterium]